MVNALELFQFYIGGVPNHQEGLVVVQNYTGCIENLYLNSSNVIQDVKQAFDYGESYKYEKFNVLYSCPVNNMSFNKFFLVFLKLCNSGTSYCTCNLPNFECLRQTDWLRRNVFNERLVPVSDLRKSRFNDVSFVLFVRLCGRKCPAGSPNAILTG